MNYLKIYNNIIEKRKYEIPQGYSEKHHIIPRSLGGSGKKSNLIKLTAREHFICHLLLTRIYNSGKNHSKVCLAFYWMCNVRKIKLNSRLYQKLKINHKLNAKIMGLKNKGIKRTEEFKKRISFLTRGSNNPMYGKKHTQEVKNKISLINKGNKYAKGVIRSKETCQKISIALKGKPQPWNSYKRSKETCELFSRIRKGKPNYKVRKKIKCLNNNVIYESVKMASKALNLSTSAIAAVARNERKHHKGFKFLYIN